MKILFLVPYAPTRIRTRPYNLIKALMAAHHEVTVVTLWSDDSELEDFRGLVEGRFTVCEKLAKYRSVWNCLVGLPGEFPLQSAYSWNPSLARNLEKLVKERDFDVVHVEHLRGARYALLLEELLRRQGKTTPVLWDSVDCISGLFALASERSCGLKSKLIARLELGRTRRYESMLLNQFARVLVTSAVDRAQLLDLACGDSCSDCSRCPLPERIKVVPNGVDLDYFTPPMRPRDRATLVISGKMSYHANEAAVMHFVQEAMPRIWAKRPDVRLWVTGKDPSRTVRELASERVEVTGTVKDIRPFLQRATLAVAPIRYGAGIQNKVLEAMACGTPVVATPDAVAALSVKPEVHLTVAQDAESFAATTLRLLENPRLRQAQGKAGRLFVEERHDWRSVARSLRDIYSEAQLEAAGEAAVHA